MSRGPHITEIERDFIRIGVAKGVKNTVIAKALKRTAASIGQQIKLMKEQGTLSNLPMSFVVDDVSETLEGQGVDNDK